MTEKTQNKDTINAENDRILINIKQSNEKGQWTCEGSKVWQCTRAEAIEQMAKALCSCQAGGCNKCYVKDNKEACLLVLDDGLYTKHAEAALDALLEELDEKR